MSKWDFHQIYKNYFNRQIKILEIKKNKLSEMKICFNGLNSRLDAAEKIKSKWEIGQYKLSKIKCKEIERAIINNNITFKICGSITDDLKIEIIGVPEGKKLN